MSNAASSIGRMAPSLTAAFWIAAYLAAVIAPLFALLAGPTPAGGGFWWDFAMALGFAGLAMMGVQFFLTARFKRATAPFGIDLIYAAALRAWIVGDEPARSSLPASIARRKARYASEPDIDALVAYLQTLR